MDFIIFTDFVTLDRYNAPTQRRLPIRNIGPQRIRTFLKQKMGLNGLVIDFCFKFTSEEIVQLLDKFVTDKTRFVGVSTSHMIGMGKTELNKLLYICDEVNNRKVPLVFGGARKSMDTNDTDNEEVVQAIEKYRVTGFGENAILNILNDGSKKNVDGDWEFKYDDMTNLDCFFDEMPFLHPSETTSFVELARGCIFSCGFCDYPYLNKKKNDYIRDKDNLYGQFKHDWDLGIRRYFICDSTFNENPAKYGYIKYANEKLGHKMELSGFLRLDLIKSVEDVDNLIDCNFTTFFFGIESWNEATRKSCTKHLGSNEKIEQTLRMIRDRYAERGLKPFIFASFIIGLPNDTPEEIVRDTEYLAANHIFDSFHHHKLKIHEKPINNNANTIKLFTSKDEMQLRNYPWTNENVLDTYLKILHETSYSQNISPFSGIFLFNFEALGKDTPHQFTKEDMLKLSNDQFYNDPTGHITANKMSINAQFVIDEYKRKILAY